MWSTLSIVFLLTMVNGAVAIKTNYAVTLKLIKFSVPDGVQMNGKSCDDCNKTVLADCDKKCDLEMTLCVESADKVSSNPNKCNGNSYDLKTVTRGSNEIIFEKKRYGNWKNPTTIKFPAPFKGVNIKIKVVDHNNLIRNKPIDNIGVKFTGADFATVPGNTISYDKDHTRSGDISATHITFNISAACSNGGNFLSDCESIKTTAAISKVTAATTTRTTTTTAPALPTYSVTLSLTTFNDLSGTTYNGKACDSSILGYPACDLSMKVCIEPMDGSIPDATDCSAGNEYDLGQLTTDLNAITFLDNFGYGEWHNPANINFFAKGFTGVRVKFQIFDTDKLGKQTSIDSLICDFDTPQFTMNSGKIEANKNNCASESKADTMISFTVQATCLQTGMDLSNCGQVPDYRVWFNWNSFSVPNTLANGKKCDTGIGKQSCDPQFKLCFEVLAHSSPDAKYCSGIGFGQYFQVGPYNDQNTINFDQNKVLPGGQWKNPGYVDFNGAFNGIMLKIYATDSDGNSKTNEIDNFWMAFQPSELQSQTQLNIVHYRNYSMPETSAEPTTYNFAIWAKCLSGSDLMNCGF